MITLAGALAVLIQPVQPPGATSPPAAVSQAPLVPFPHPLITEILYAVPTGAAGDANKDGTRDVNGDEFVELVNPHDKPIQLAGYVLADRELGEGEKKFTSLRFKFPALELKPGEVVVVFNGHDQKWMGPVGNATAGAAGNDRFDNARVLTMGITSSKQGLANKGDCIQLIAPDGMVVHCITWGDAGASKGAVKVEKAPLVSKESIQRATAAGPLEPHAGGIPFSPGQWPLSKSESKAPESKPGGKSPEAK